MEEGKCWVTHSPSQPHPRPRLLAGDPAGLATALNLTLPLRPLELQPLNLFVELALSAEGAFDVFLYQQRRVHH